MKKPDQQTSQSANQQDNRHIEISNNIPASQIASGVVAGVVGFGAAAALSAYFDDEGGNSTTPSHEHHNVFNSDITRNTVIENIHTTLVYTPGGGMVALSTQDDVPTFGGTFHQAFVEARHSLGAGGVFKWNGKLYGTYNADEWSAMGPVERNLYFNHVSELQGQTAIDIMTVDQRGRAVTDPDTGLTFAEAFSDARVKTGAGSVFEWNGKYYGTFTKEEWYALTDKERGTWDYESQRQIDDGQIYHPGTNNDIIDSGTSDVLIEDRATDSKGEDSSDQSKNNVEIVDNDVTTDDNEVHLLTKHTFNIGDREFNAVAMGHDFNDMAVFVDIDNDGVIDLVTIDDNLDGIITADETKNIRDLGITIAELENTVISTTDRAADQLPIDDQLPDDVNSPIDDILPL